uniref:Uncharacterized protein LOC111103654 n=1 Tax=Crassostrea virginica TaxID=6565 RepID=A0A8B8AML6_CRAVI|nr:uncharacterized protein LOC111103654 [Crassostrea virginica]
MTENINEGERILEDFLQKASDNYEDSEETIVATVSMERTVENLMAAVAEKEKEVYALRRDLAAAKREISALKETAAQQSSWRTQLDGRPRAGVLPKDLAEKNGMMELMPGSGVYVYAKDIRIASKKASGTAIARYLMLVFYTNHELVERQHLRGKWETGIRPFNCESHFWSPE